MQFWVKNHFIFRALSHENYARLNFERTIWNPRVVQRIEELESSKNKLLGRLTESEERCGAAQSRCDSLEATKSRLQGDVENLSADLETSNQRESQENFIIFLKSETFQFFKKVQFFKKIENFSIFGIFQSWTKNKDSLTKLCPMQRASKKMPKLLSRQPSKKLEWPKLKPPN